MESKQTKEPDGYVYGADFYKKDSLSLYSIGFKEKCIPVYFNTNEPELLKILIDLRDGDYPFINGGLWTDIDNAIKKAT